MKFDAILYFAIFLLLRINGYSQNITGRVTDESDNPISGVTVLIKGTKTATATANNGAFSIQASLGNVLVFSAVSYETKEVKITTASTVIRLSLHVRPLEQLVVSGNVVATKRKADISSVAILTGKDVEALPGFNMVDILEGVVPGITVSSSISQGFRGQYFRSGLLVRGSPIKIYVDGIEYATSDRFDFLAMINKDDIDRIEILRGPSAATLYGSGALGGVMLITTKKGIMDKTTINVKASVGFQRSKYTEKEKQFQQVHNAEFYYSIKNFNYVIGGDYRSQDDYLPKGSLKSGGGYGSFTWAPGKFKFILSSDYNANSTTDPRVSVFDKLTDVGDFFWHNSDSAYVKGTSQLYSGTISLSTNFRPTSWWTHNLILGYSENRFRYFTDASLYIDTTLITYYVNRGEEVQAQDWTYKDKTPSSRYNNLIKIGKPKGEFKMDILSGFEYSYTKHTETIYYNSLNYTTSGGFSYTPNLITGAPLRIYKRESTGAFLQLSPSWKEKYFLVAGLRYEKTNVSAAVVNPRIGFTTNFESSGFIFKPRINWGRSITPPPYYITHPRPPQGRFIFVANPDIKQKEQSGAEIAMEAYDKDDKFKFEIIRYDNIIKNDFTTRRTVTNNNIIFSYDNIGKYAYRGWEFLAEYKFNNLKITGNYSIINATYIDSFAGRKTFYKADRVDNIPNYAAGASVNYVFHKLIGNSDLFAITVSLTSSGKMIALNDYQYEIAVAKWLLGSGSPPDGNSYYRETSGVTKFNLNMNYQFNSNIDFFMQVQNFTNNTMPDWDKGSPLPGASWMFGLKLNVDRLAK